MTSSTQATSTPKVAVNDIGSEEEFLAAIDLTIKYFNDGDIVEGTVVKVDRDEVLLDIGYKTEGVIPSRELSIKHDVDPHEVVKTGEQIEALVLQRGRQGRPPDPVQEAGAVRARVGHHRARSRKRTASSPAPSSRSSRAA